MVNIWALAAASSLALALGGCTSTLKATNLSETSGRFETSSKVSTDNLTITRPFDRAKFGKLAYVKTIGGENKTINGFFT